MYHLVAGQPDAGDEAVDGVLEHQHEDSRSRSQAGKQCHRTTVDENTDDDNHGDKDGKNLQYAAERLEILARGTAGAGVQITQPVDDAGNQTCRGNGEIDGRKPTQPLLHHGELIEDKRHQLPYYQCRCDVAGCAQYLTIEDDIVPMRLGTLYQPENERHEDVLTEPFGKECQQEGNHGQQHMAHDGYGMAVYTQRKDNVLYEDSDLFECVVDEMTGRC